MKGLIIRAPWIDLILCGRKTWEMRTKATSIRGRIALIRAKSGLVVGTADLRECLPALTPARLRETVAFHAIPDAEMDGAIANGWTTPWVLEDVRRLEPPIPYSHPSGAVTWVTLSDTILHAKRPRDATMVRDLITPEPISMKSPPAALPVASAPTASTAWVDIPITQGNVDNSHIYLRGAEALLPKDAIGGRNEQRAAKRRIRVRFDPGDTVDTDIAGDKMILRKRSPVTTFFKQSGAKGGDVVRLTRVSSHEFVITLRRP
jgi:hypothetical protein